MILNLSLKPAHNIHPLGCKDTHSGLSRNSLCTSHLFERKLHTRTDLSRALALTMMDRLRQTSMEEIPSKCASVSMRLKCISLALMMSAFVKESANDRLSFSVQIKPSPDGEISSVSILSISRARSSSKLT